MFSTKNIVRTRVNSADHTTLVAAVKAAGLVETRKAPVRYSLRADNEHSANFRLALWTIC